MHPSELIHPSETILLGLVHGERVAGVADRAHFSACESCRVRLADLEERERQIGLLLEGLDHPMPSATTAELVPLRPRRATRRTLLAGGAALLVAAAAAAATLPASLVHRWMNRWTGHPNTAAPAATPPASAPSATGVAVPVPEGKLTIRIRRPQASGAIDIVLVGRSDVAVRSVGGDVAYEVGEGSLLIDNRAPAERYEIEVPAGLASLVVMVGDRVAFRKQNDLVEPRAGAVRYHIQLHPKT